MPPPALFAPESKLSAGKAAIPQTPVRATAGERADVIEITDRRDEASAARPYCKVPMSAEAESAFSVGSASAPSLAPSNLNVYC